MKKKTKTKTKKKKLQAIERKTLSVHPLVLLSVFTFTNVHTYIHTYFIGSSPQGFSESILQNKMAGLDCCLLIEGIMMLS